MRIKSTLKDVQRQSEIKRINTRISSIAKTFGMESETYKKTIAPFLNDSYSSVTHFTKKGVLQFDTGLKKISSRISKKAIGIAKRSVKTLGQLFEGQEEFSKEKKIKNVEEMNKLDLDLKKSTEYLYQNYTDSEIQYMFPELYKDGKLSYDQIRNIINRVEDEQFDEFADFYESTFDEFANIYESIFD